jgi:hypothetical protein
MEDGKSHSHQSLAHPLTLKKKYGGFEDVKPTTLWACSLRLAKPRLAPHSAVLYATLLQEPLGTESAALASRLKNA